MYKATLTLQNFIARSTVVRHQEEAHLKAVCPEHFK
jgi:hypothetical protein